MNGRLLTRRMLPTLVAALSFGGYATAANAATTAEVDPATGTLVITGGSETNSISIYRKLPGEEPPVNPINPKLHPHPTVKYDVIYVHDGDSSTLPADPDFPAPTGTPVLNPGAGCTAEDAHTFKCTTAYTEDAQDPTGTGESSFTKVVVDLGGGDDGFFEFIGTDSKGISAQPLGIPVYTFGGGGSDSLFGTRDTDYEWGDMNAARDSNGNIQNLATAPTAGTSGGVGDDTLRGNAGNDFFYPGGGGNTVGGSNAAGGDPGIDTVDYSDRTSGIAVSLDNNADDGAGCTLNPNHPGTSCNDHENVRESVENITTTPFNDLVAGDKDTNVIRTLGGDDVIYGGGAYDDIDAGSGTNTIYGDTATYTDAFGTIAMPLPAFDGPAAADKISSDTGDDTIYGGDDPVTDGLGQTIAGDVITAGAGKNVVYGQGGNDNITTLGDKDKIEGGTGDDTISAGNGGTVGDEQTVDGGLGNDNPITTGTGADIVNGREGNDKITDSGGTNVLNGQEGQDTIQGGPNDDTINAGPDNDKVSAGNGTNVTTLGLGADDQIDSSHPTGGTGPDTIYGGDGTSPAGDDTDIITDSGGGNPEIDGDNGNDQITITGNGNDFVYGGHKGFNVPDDGNDHIETGNGDDTISGGALQDYMDGGNDNDTISYEEKVDPVYAVVGESQHSGTWCDDSTRPADQNCEGDTVLNAESLIGGSNDDVLAGDLIEGTGVNRRCKAATNNFVTTLKGNAGNDQLFGCTGNDFLFGGPGDDTLVGGRGSDEIHGGSNPVGQPGDTDAVSYQDCGQNGDPSCHDDKGVTVTLSDNSTTADDGPTDNAYSAERDNLFGDIENVTGSDFPDNLSGSGQHNTLRGLQGNDTLDGGAGPDDLIGDQGRDLVTYAQRGTENIKVTLDGVANDGGSSDTNGDNVDVTVNDITTAAGNDTIIGQPIATQGDGIFENKFDAGPGRDVMDGKRGADEFIGGDGDDTVAYSERAADETINAAISDQPNSGSALDRNSQGQMDLIHQDIENLRGGDEPDNFLGDRGANTLVGGGGADDLDGDAGNDRIEGGEGNDTLTGGAGQDSLQPGLGQDMIYGGGATDTVDYLGRLTAVDVSFDNEPNDGEANENDNVQTDVELCAGCGTVTGDQGSITEDPGTSGGGSTEGGLTNTSTNTSSNSNSSNTTQTTNTNVTTTQKDDDTSDQKTTASDTPQTSSMQTAVSVTKKVKGVRTVLVRGRVLVKARNGQAKASDSCKGGGKVLVTIRKAGKVVGKRLVKVSKTCTFLAPVTLKRGTAGKLKIEVNFLGNRVLKPTKRTTNLQVNG